MYRHVIVFVADWWTELDRCDGRPLKRVLLPRGARLGARLRPRIVEGGRWPVEVADLCLDDGAVLWAVPFAAFSFADRS
jgi:hypothetical protein